MTVTTFDENEPVLSRDGNAMFAGRSDLFERIQGREKRSNKALIIPAVGLAAAVALFGATQYASNQKRAEGAETAPAPAARVVTPPTATPPAAAPEAAMAAPVAAVTPPVSATPVRVAEAPPAPVARARAPEPVARSRPAPRAAAPAAEAAPLITPPPPAISAPATPEAVVAAPVMVEPSAAPVLD